MELTAIRYCVIASGSSGNCTYVETCGARFLIDAARVGQKYITNSLATLGVDIKGIDGIVSTHLHGDHVDCSVTLPLCRKHDIPLYIHDDATADLLNRSRRFEELIDRGLLRYFTDDPFEIGNATWILPFHVTHGGGGWNTDYVGRPCGFRINEGSLDTPDHSMVYATDLGEAPQGLDHMLTGVQALVLESNHDTDMEKASSRPAFLIKWVLGNRGHLSNEQAADIIENAVALNNGSLRHITLAHLSEDCNTPQIAYRASAGRLYKNDILDNLNIFVARQREISRDIIIS